MKVKTFVVRMETMLEEFWDVVSRDEDEALKALSTEDLTEVFEFVILSDVSCTKCHSGINSFVISGATIHEASMIFDVTSIHYHIKYH